MIPITQSFQDLVYKFHESLQPLDVKLIYEGEINHAIMKVFTKLTENGFKEEDFKGQKKVFHVMVECLENISKHSEQTYGIKKENSGNGIFLITNNDKEVNVITGNIIKKEKEQEMIEQMDYINTLSKKELSNYHKIKLKENIIMNNGGAGLGFIDIARKTENKIAYSFKPIDEKYSFFILSAKINK